jgi:uncharacterized protein
MVLMKYLLVLLVVGIVLWLMFGRSRKPADRADAARPAAGGPAEPAPMLACAHCGVHLPRDEALRDGVGRAYCSEAHRLAGPRPQ